MKNIVFTFSLLSVLALSIFTKAAFAGSHDHGNEGEPQEEVEKGPNNGRMLVDGSFALELQLFENGLPPEFRIFATNKGQPVAADKVDVSMQLVRLGNKIDSIAFAPNGEYLRGDKVVYEPHSFVVKLEATYQGKTYQWHYDNFEGRTHITDGMAAEMAIETEVVSEKAMQITTSVFGQLVLPEAATSHVYARYPGKVTQLNVKRGQRVEKGQTLMQIQSNDSLQTYTLFSPISGVVAEQNVSLGEQTQGNRLLTIVNTKELHAELKVFPKNQSAIKVGAKVSLSIAGAEQVVTGNIFDRLVYADAQQAMTYRVKIDNANMQYLPGQFVQAEVVTREFTAPMAVKTSGLQAFRDFTVVFAKIGEDYEVRMLELGRRSGEWVEVLSGIEAGTEYVSNNSYIIKADIEKSGASHDH